ncbi:MAG: hypothetical protein IJ848_03610 [Alphaproteobacteria bacterium]|nr:hypothetical protein [Alphaproteobacteria bacterium]
MLFLSPFIGYYFFKKQEDAESNGFDDTFGIILSIMLILTVLSQLISCGSNILSFEIPLTPGLLCCGVNFLAIGLYYLWRYAQQKFVTTEHVKLFRICNIVFLLISIIYSFIVSNHYTPFKLLQLHHNDKLIISTMDEIKNKNKIYNNIDEFINEIDNKRKQNNIKNLVKNKHLMYEKIDDNSCKLAWKTHLTKEEFKNITRWHYSYSPSLYEKDNKIINIKEEKIGDKEMPEELKKIIQNNEKIAKKLDTENTSSNNNSNQDKKNEIQESVNILKTDNTENSTINPADKENNDKKDN